MSSLDPLRVTCGSLPTACTPGQPWEGASKSGGLLHCKEHGKIPSGGTYANTAASHYWDLVHKDGRWKLRSTLPQSPMSGKPPNQLGALIHGFRVDFQVGSAPKRASKPRPPLLVFLCQATPIQLEPQKGPPGLPVASRFIPATVTGFRVKCLEESSLLQTSQPDLLSPSLSHGQQKRSCGQVRRRARATMESLRETNGHQQT